MLVVFLVRVMSHFEALDGLGLQLLEPFVDVDRSCLDTENERSVADGAVGANEGEVVGHVGNCEAEVSFGLVEAPLITSALLSIPWLIHIDNYPIELFKTPEVSAKLQNAEAPVIPTQRLKLFSDLLGAQDVTDRLLNVPLSPEVELESWPRTIFQVAGADPLRDDGLLFASKLRSMR